MGITPITHRIVLWFLLARQLCGFALGLPQRMLGRRQGTAPHNVRRRASRAVAAVCASCLFMSAAGTPAVAQDAVLSVDSVRLFNNPADGLHPLGSVVSVRVGFNRGPIVVTGRPRVALTIGTETRYAGFLRTSTSGQSMYFNYVVQASDRDDDGVSIPANALTLDGGSIRDAHGNDADLSHGAVPDNPEHRVDGGHDPPPTVARVRVANRPLSGDTFGPDEEIRAQVIFNKPVTVTASPTTPGGRSTAAGVTIRRPQFPGCSWSSRPAACTGAVTRSP